MAGRVLMPARSPASCTRSREISQARIGRPPLPRLYGRHSEMERRRRAVSGWLKMRSVHHGASRLIASAFYVGKHNTTLTAFVALFLLLGGVAMLALLCLGLVVGIVVSTHRRRKEAQDRVRTTYVVVEIEAARITAAHSIDDDANAIILHDGLGHGVYINSHPALRISTCPTALTRRVVALTLFSREAATFFHWRTFRPRSCLSKLMTQQPDDP